MSDKQKTTKTLKNSGKPLAKPNVLDGPGSVMQFDLYGTSPKNKSGKKK
jgi:hypothetical protein